MTAKTVLNKVRKRVTAKNN